MSTRGLKFIIVGGKKFTHLVSEVFCGRVWRNYDFPEVANVISRPWYRRGKRGSGNLSNWARPSLLINGRSGAWTQAVWLITPPCNHCNSTASHETEPSQRFTVTTKDKFGEGQRAMIICNKKTWPKREGVGRCWERLHWRRNVQTEIWKMSRAWSMTVFLFFFEKRVGIVGRTF